MGTSLLVSEQEYLTTSYEPDCEYDEGVLLERNLGEQPHSSVAYVWLVNPEERRGGFYEAKDVVLRTEGPAIEVPLAELFQALDD